MHYLLLLGINVPRLLINTKVYKEVDACRDFVPCLCASRVAKPSMLVPDMLRLFIEILQRDEVCERSFLRPK